MTALGGFLGAKPPRTSEKAREAEMTAGIGLGLGTALGGFLGGRQQRKGAEASAGASRYGIDVGKQQSVLGTRETREQQALQQELLRRQRQAEAQAAGGVFGELTAAAQPREERLEQLFGEAPPELQTLQEDILSGQAEQLQQGTSQLQAALAGAGVRGGQAATQLSRGIGGTTKDASRDLNRILANEAMQRAGAERDYQGGLSQLLLSQAYDPELLAQKTGAFADIEPVTSYTDERAATEESLLDLYNPAAAGTAGSTQVGPLGPYKGRAGAIGGLSEDQFAQLQAALNARLQNRG